MKLSTFTLVLSLGFSFISVAQTSIAEFTNGGNLWGYMSADGTTIIAPSYSKSTPFLSSGIAVVYDRKAKNSILLNKKGEVVPTSVSNFTVVDLFNKSKGETANEVIIIKSGAKVGILDAKGQVLIAPSYDKISDFHNDYATGKKGSLVSIIQSNGTEIAAPKEVIDIRRFSEGLAPYKDVNNVFGFINDKGVIAISAQFMGVGYFINGIAWARDVNNVLGFIDKTGKWVIQPEYNKVQDFDPLTGLALVKKGEEDYYINLQNQALKIVGATKLGEFHEGLAYAEKNDKIGFIDKSGAWVVSPAYDHVKNVESGVARVRASEKWGLINASGVETITPKYERLEGLSDNLMAFRMSGKWGFVDINGKEIVAATYEDVKDFQNGLALVKKGGKWGVINLSGQEVIAPQYIKIAQFVQVD